MTRSMITRSCAAAVLLAVAVPARATEPAPTEAASRVQQIAVILEVDSVIDKLLQSPAPTNVEAALDRLALRADALAELERLSLLVDATLARLQQEQFASSSARDFLNDRHERAVATWNITAVLVGNGISIVGSSLQFDGQTQSFVGDGLIIGGAVMATAFSVVALVRRDRGRLPSAITTGLLARPLGRAPAPNSDVPPVIWRYLDTPLVGEHGSLRSQLLEKWAREGNISLQPSPAARRQIDLLTRPLSRHEVLPAELLDTRAAMLGDLRARIAALNVDVELLVRTIRGRR